MKTKVLIWIVVAVVAAAALWWCFGREDSGNETVSSSSTGSGSSSGSQGSSNGGTGSDDAGSIKPGRKPIIIKPIPVAPVVEAEKPVAEVASLDNVRKIMGRP